MYIVLHSPPNGKSIKAAPRTYGDREAAELFAAGLRTTSPRHAGLGSPS